MEKEQLKLNYTLSGVKMLRILGIAALVVGVVCVFVTLGYWISYLAADSWSDEAAGMMTWLVARMTAVVFIIAAICLALSTIARAAVYQRAVIEQKYDCDPGQNRDKNV